jgi:hypothetical protein
VLKTSQLNIGFCRFICSIVVCGYSFLYNESSSAQSSPEHISNQAVYDFLDELANDGVIEIVSIIKPFSRAFIAGKLLEAEGQRERLTRRQGAMLDFFINDYGLELNREIWRDVTIAKRDSTFAWSFLPPMFSYRDSLFRFYLKPVIGAQYYLSDNGNIRHSWGGASVHAYIGNNWAVWASLRDNQQIGDRLASPEFLTQALGGNYKGITGGGAGGEFSEMRGGISWSWNWGSLSLEKDHIMWGDNYNGANILSGRTPSYSMIKLHMKPASWLDFNYHHGWLHSMVTDSLRSYFPSPGDPMKTVYHNKYLASNIFTITPFSRLNVSLGNLVIYSEPNVRPEYLIPFMFYKSIVHTQTAGVRGHNHNSAFYVNFSSRQIRHLHLYATWFVDEFSLTRIGDPNRTNFTSTKTGFRLNNWPLKDVALTGEYTFTYPKTFQHRTPVTTYTSNNFNLGHYLQDNAKEIFLSVRVKPFRGLFFEMSYLLAEKGNVVPYIYNTPGSVDRDPFMKDVVWSNSTFTFGAQYILYNNFNFFADYRISDIRGYDVDERPAQEYLNLFTPSFFQGKNNIFTFGMQIGF